MENDYESQQESIEEVTKNLIDTNSIIFSADITNEEALLFQSLKTKYGKRLICPEAKAYQDFLKAYSNSSGYHLFKGDLDTLAASDIVISFGLWFQDEKAESKSLIHSMAAGKKAKFFYMHPIEDTTLQPSITQFIKYEVGSEEGVAGLLAYTLLENKELPNEIEDILEDLDIGYLSAESNVGEEELESMNECIDDETQVSLIIGYDVYTHPKAEQIAKLIALLERYAGVNIICVPPEKNALGIALICDLDEVVQGQNIIYQSTTEGTCVNSNKCIYLHEQMQTSGLDSLNRIADTLGYPAQDLIEYSDQLPQDQGFEILKESDIKNPCIYKLIPQARTRDFSLDEIDDLPVYDGAVVYTYKIEKTTTDKREIEGLLKGSRQFAMATKLEDGDRISFEIEGVKFIRVFKIDTHMKGVIALNPTSDIELSASLISSYRFSRLAFEKINNQKIGNNDE